MSSAASAKSQSRNVMIFGFVEAAFGFFVAVAIGFCAFAAMAVSIMLRVKPNPIRTNL